MAYHNRLDQFKNTLKSIEYHYANKYDFEIILVDDASNDYNRIKDNYPQIKVIEISKEEKGNRLNACIPFNIGFQHAQGNVIIIQNPENVHVSDIFKKVEENLERKKYLTFGCYSITQEQTRLLDNINWKENVTKQFLNIINPIKNNISNIFENGWYNHSKYRPTEYHFLSAIHKDDLFEIGGFDEEYANGTSFDDNEFLFRIKKKYETKIIDVPFCLHQWHEHNRNTNANFFKVHTINENLWKETQRRGSWMPQKSRLL